VDPSGKQVTHQPQICAPDPGYDWVYSKIFNISPVATGQMQDQLCIYQCNTPYCFITGFVVFAYWLYLNPDDANVVEWSLAAIAVVITLVSAFLLADPLTIPAGLVAAVLAALTGLLISYIGICSSFTKDGSCVTFNLNNPVVAAFLPDLAFTPGGCCKAA
jgi:hypothetical protein